jgi:hypothetical protein
MPEARTTEGGFYAEEISEQEIEGPTCVVRSVDSNVCRIVDTTVMTP